MSSNVSQSTSHVILVCNTGTKNMVYRLRSPIDIRDKNFILSYYILFSDIKKQYICICLRRFEDIDYRKKYEVYSYKTYSHS